MTGMTWEEFKPVLGSLQARWYLHEIPKVAQAQMYADLRMLGIRHVQQAIDHLFDSGLRFPPTAGQIKRKAVELQCNLLPWPETWRVIRRALAYPFADERRDETLALHPIVSSFVAEVGWDHLRDPDRLERQYAEHARWFVAWRMTQVTPHEQPQIEDAEPYQLEAGSR